MKQTKHKNKAALCGFFVMTLVTLSGCNGGKYEKITLQESTSRSSEITAEEKSSDVAVVDITDITDIADSSSIKAFSKTASMDENQTAAVANGRIVAIDAGHQTKGNSEKEPVGPGSATMKAKVASGTQGIVTKLPEYKLTLSVSQKLERILEERGYKVVMIRESNDVNISNAERAETANQSGASIFVRIHANSLDNSMISGVLSMCQTSDNPYNGELHDASYLLSRKITDCISTATGFKNRGVQETDTMSGINWCDIPVSIVEMGFMSNPEEDRKLAQDEYQEKIAAGIADGIDAYFES
ncbi:MAG: N-acetylmuramoyl-L-alanine amidase [Clostridium sp.]